MSRHAINLEEDNVFLIANKGWCWLDCQSRFRKDFTGSHVGNFTKYAEACPNETDLKFLKSLMASERWDASYFKRDLQRAVTSLESVLANLKN